MENRVLPLVRIEDVSFFADALNFQFIEKDNPGNRFNTKLMKIYDDRYEFAFDKNTKNIYAGPWDEGLPRSHVSWVEIRPLPAIDPHGMDLRPDIADRWQEYYTSPLPKKSFQGIEFYIDPERHCFRQVHNRWNQIDFNKILTTENATGFYFDRLDKNVPLASKFNSLDPPEQKYIPKHIVFVKCPSLLEIDQLCKNIKYREIQRPEILEKKQVSAKKSRGRNARH
uniref:hypothetical protein n=1 Tax=Pedobacter schmidteae TaxID=2201271 RepID=UPI000EAD6E03|nr:hypothetical protein [Pedobacter schmidteae]